MSIYKRRGSRFYWYAIPVPGGRGRYIRGSCATTNRQEALAVEQAMKLAVNKQLRADQLHGMIDALLGVEDAARRELPLASVIAEHDRIFEASGRTCSRKQANDKRRVVRTFVEWVGKNRPNVTTAQGVSREVAVAYAAKLMAAGTRDKTRANTISILGGVWRVLGAVHEDVRDPWSAVVPPVRDAARGMAFTREQEAAVMAAAGTVSADWELACMIARNTGLRLGDIIGLRWDALDDDARALRITPRKTERSRICVLLPLTGDVWDALARRRADAPIGAPRVFVGSDGNLRGVPFSRVLAEAGLAGRGFTFHSWRHTFRTRLSEAGVSDDVAKRLGGWRVDKTAMRYDHAERIDEMRRAVEAAASIRK